MKIRETDRAPVEGCSQEERCTHLWRSKQPLKHGHTLSALAVLLRGKGVDLKVFRSTCGHTLTNKTNTHNFSLSPQTYYSISLTHTHTHTLARHRHTLVCLSHTHTHTHTHTRTQTHVHTHIYTHTHSQKSFSKCT